MEDDILDNEREWRRYIIRRLDGIASAQYQTSRQIGEMKVWNVVFRLAGAGLFAIVLLWIEHKVIN